MPGSVLLVLSYVSVAVFVAAVVCRAAKISRLPIHLRWELYPVAHEKGRASYGGSYLEESDWWTKPRESSLVGELKGSTTASTGFGRSRSTWVCTCWPG